MLSVSFPICMFVFPSTLLLIFVYLVFFAGKFGEQAGLPSYDGSSYGRAS